MDLNHHAGGPPVPRLPPSIGLDDLHQQTYTVLDGDGRWLLAFRFELSPPGWRPHTPKGKSPRLLDDQGMKHLSDLFTQVFGWSVAGHFCAWCPKTPDEKLWAAARKVSHSICPQCKERLEADQKSTPPPHD